MTATVDDCVALGGAFLDEHDDPGWWREDVPNAIDLDTLALDSTRLCVLGQRCPLEVLHRYARVHGYRVDDAAETVRYIAYATALSGKLTWEERDPWAVSHGFTLPGDGRRGDSWDAWNDLTSAWWVLINDRRKHAADAGDVR